MSIVVWDGKTLAADKRASCGSLIRTTTKIFSLRGCLVGYDGDADAGEELIAWFKAGEDREKFPETQRDKEAFTGMLVILPNKKVLKYERTPHPIKFSDKKFAIGSGRDFALAAMFLGKTAADAVRISCIFDSGCGNGVDVLHHAGNK